MNNSTTKVIEQQNQISPKTNLTPNRNKTEKPKFTIQKDPKKKQQAFVYSSKMQNSK